MEDFKLKEFPKFLDLLGDIKTHDTPPTYIPKKLSEQIIMVSGTPSSLYVYSYTLNKWKVFGSSDNT